MIVLGNDLKNKNPEVCVKGQAWLGKAASCLCLLSPVMDSHLNGWIRRRMAEPGKGGQDGPSSQLCHTDKEGLMLSAGAL